MKIIEFNGLPGCGKTTTSRDLEACFSKSGTKAQFYDDIHEKFPSGLAKRCRYILHNWSFKEIRILYKISTCFTGIKTKEKWKRILYVEQIACNYRKFMSKDGICISDQGLVQGVVSIGYIHDLKNDKYKKKFAENCLAFLIPYAEYVIYVNSDIAPEESYKRLKTREQNYGRFDQMQEDAVLSGLNKQKKMFGLIWEECMPRNSKLIVINGFDSSSYNAAYILNHINPDL